MKIRILKLLLLILSIPVFTGFGFGQTQPNFIFIVVDDLNDYPQPFNNDGLNIETPHIKQLADSGTVYLNAFSNAAGCAPSRTSFLSGKDLYYTQVYNNEQYINSFRGNFTEEKGNSYVVTLPEWLKDSAGYYTMAINKVFHNPDNNDFDKTDNDKCNKIKSWSRMVFYEPMDSAEIFDPIAAEYSFGDKFLFGPIPDSLEYLLDDHIASDTAIRFLQEYADGTEDACGRPFFLAVGFKYPHSDRLVPESYFLPDYVKSIYDEPFNKPFNDPKGAYPANGIIMEPQPDTMYQDYYNLPENGIAQGFTNYGAFVGDLFSYYDSLEVVPEIEPGLDDDEKRFILEETLKADYLMGYIAAVEYVDAMIGRVVDALYANPELAENTIIVLVSDHGYSLGEKRHWEKWCLWETDIRIPVIIVDPTKTPGQQVDQSISMLDIYPTICDLAGVHYPLFPDSSRYLDGVSFSQTLDDPSSFYEHPALTTYKKNWGPSSCYPSFSVRNERFHYINYRQNNDGTHPISFCDSSYFGYEEELYEVGVHRETDPHEWNNLISNEDYAPVIQFMQQFFPDSSLYSQKTVKALIKNEAVDCFLSLDDSIYLSIDLYDTTGILIDPVASFDYKWSNNLTDDIFYGEELDFPVALIDDAAFESNNRIIIYLQVYDSLDRLLSVDLKYFYINPENEPEASYTVSFDSTETATISDFTVSGEYGNYWWDFGEGNMYFNETPGPFTYITPGLHTVTLYVEYGNDCVKSFTTNFNSVETQELNTEISVVPNPADQQVVIYLPQSFHPVSISIFNSAGILVYQSVNFDEDETISVDTHNLIPGYYLAKIVTDNSIFSSPFIIQH